MLSKKERLAVIYVRLQEAPPADSQAAAYQLLCDTMNKVENELTSIPFDPEMWRDDGRLYPPQEDNAWTLPENQGIRRYRSVGHHIDFAANGAIEVRNRATDVVEFRKAGKDGRYIST